MNRIMRCADKKNGFTLVEMLIVAPIVMLVIGAFISAIIFMIGNILATRDSSNLQYSIQDALNRIEKDVSLSGGYLATNNISVQSPQGYNNDTTAFHNASATNGTSLILNVYATASNPLNSTQDFVYAPAPNACDSSQVSQNPKITFNIVYFIKDGALWRRVIAPNNYLTAGCSKPWQQPSCYPGQTGAYCVSQDEKLVSGIVSGSGFTISYFTSPSSTTPNTAASDSSQSDANRQTALSSTNTISVTIAASGTTAGRPMSQTSSIRATSKNNNIASNSMFSVANGGTWLYKRAITISNSGSALNNYQLQVSPFADSGFIDNTGLVGSWHFGSTTSGSITNGTKTDLDDSSGYSNYGTASNANGTGMAWANGKFSGAVSFDGIDDRIDLKNAPTTGTGSFSMFAWIKTSASGKRRQIINYGSSTTNQAAWLFVNTSNKLEFDLSNTAGPSSAVTVNDGAWHLVGAVNTNGSIQLYVDGIASGSAATMSPNIVSGDITPAIGGPTGPYSSSDWYFSGQVDEVSIFNRALSSSEISYRYGGGSPKVRTDYQDIRFAKSDGTELAYQKETDGKYWINYGGTLPTGSTTIYMYYGNPSATFGGNYANNGSSVFDFFDDFSGSSLSANWNAVSTTGTVIVNGGNVTIANTSGGSTDKPFIQAKFTPSTTSYVVEAKHSEGAYNRNRFMVSTDSNQNPITFDYGYFYTGGSTASATANVYWNGTSYTALSAGTNYITRWVIVDGSTYNFYTYNYATNSLLDARSTTTSTICRYILFAVTDVSGTSSSIDFVRVRQNAATIPSASTPGAETAP